MGLPVMMENDATACLLAELTFARMDGIRDAVLVAVAEGVGTCVLANGQLVVRAQRNGGRVRPYIRRSQWPPLRMREERMLGSFQLVPGRPALLPGATAEGPCRRLSGTAQFGRRRRFGCRAGPGQAGHVDWSRIADDHRQRFSQHDSDCRRPDLCLASFWAGDREGGS